ncbi:unnamed protein product, partial [Lota lota]
MARGFFNGSGRCRVLVGVCSSIVRALGVRFARWWMVVRPRQRGEGSQLVLRSLAQRKVRHCGQCVLTVLCGTGIRGIYGGNK